MLAFTGSLRKCPFHLYQCGSKECLEPKLVCNGLTNCADGSDEGVGCAQRNCSSASAPLCDHSCVSTPNGPVSRKCICFSVNTQAVFRTNESKVCMEHFFFFFSSIKFKMTSFSLSPSSEVLLWCRFQATVQHKVLCGC